MDAITAVVVETGGWGTMSELLTAGITVVLGYFVFVLGQFTQRLCIEPIQEQKRVIGEIAYLLDYYGNVASVAQAGLAEEASRELRRLAGELRSTLRTVLGYRFFAFLGVVEKKDDVITATTELKGVSLSIRMHDNPAARRHMSAVVQALNIPQAPPGPTDATTETPGEAEEGTSRP
jgi:hypothetical protein